MLTTFGKGNIKCLGGVETSTQILPTEQTKGLKLKRLCKMKRRSLQLFQSMYFLNGCQNLVLRRQDATTSLQNFKTNKTVHARKGVRKCTVQSSTEHPAKKYLAPNLWETCPVEA